MPWALSQNPEGTLEIQLQAREPLSSNAQNTQLFVVQQRGREDHRPSGRHTALEPHLGNGAREEDLCLARGVGRAIAK